MKPIEVPDDIRPLLDAYRAEPDLAQPEMSSLRNWLAESPRHRETLNAAQAEDQQIKNALIDVAVPVGLDELIVRSLDSANATLSSRGFDKTVDFKAPTVVSLAKRSNEGVKQGIPAGAKPKRSATWAWGIAIAGVAAAVLAIINGNGPATPVNQTFTARELCEASLQWIQIADNSGGSSLDENSEEPMIAPKGQWKQLHTENGPVDCLLTSTSGGIRVFRFKLPAKKGSQLPSEFSATPDLPNQNFACSARRRGNTIEVIAVEGGASNYRIVFND